MVLPFFFSFFNPRPTRVYLRPRALSLALARLQRFGLAGAAVGILVGSGMLMLLAAVLLAGGGGLWLATERLETLALEYEAAARGAERAAAKSVAAFVARLSGALAGNVVAALFRFSGVPEVPARPRLPALTLSPRLLPVPRITRT